MKTVLRGIAAVLAVPVFLFLLPGMLVLIYFGLGSDLLKKWQIGWQQGKATKAIAKQIVEHDRNGKVSRR